MSEENKYLNELNNGIRTFPVKYALEAIKETITTNAPSKPSKEEIINEALRFHSQGNTNEAAKSYQAFIDQGFKDHRVFSNYGAILKDLGKLSEAESSIRKAIELKPNYAMAHFNLGTLLKAIGKFEQAKASHKQAIVLKPDFVEAHINLGNTLKELGRLEDAKKCFEKVIDLKPDNPEANAFLGMVNFEQSKSDLAIKYLSKSADLLRGKNNKNPNQLKSFCQISKAKIEHDIEQFQYIVSQGVQTKKFTELSALYQRLASEINWPSETKKIPLKENYKALIKDSYNLLIHQADTTKLISSAVNKSLNEKEITNNYFDHEFGLTYIDDFLSPKALEALRKFLLESTIWFDIKDNGYLGAYLKEGLANPLILQIAEELKNKFPKIFKDYPINQIWAYKYDNRSKKTNSPLKGINVHADFAAINVNFWLTPSEANLNSNSGGMIVYDVEAPKEWNFKTYNTNEEKIREELKKSKGNTKVIPYKGNRAVLFNSNLLHETDTYEFKEGYENRRINVTMLFGKRN